MIPTVVPETAYKEEIDFQKYWLVLKRRWLPATVICIGVTGVCFLSALSKQPIYEAEAQLLIKMDESSKLVGLEDETGQIEVISKDSNPVVTEAKILQSRPIIEQVIQQLNLKNEQGEYVDYREIAGNLDARPIIGTDILQVFYRHPDPERAATIVNKVIELYIKEDALSNRTAVASARQFIEAQLPKVEAKVARAETDLRRFKTKNNIASLSQEATNSIDTIQSIEAQIDTTTANLEDLNSRLDRLSNRLNISWEEAIAISSLSQSAVPELITELQKVRIELVDKSNRFSDNAPQITSLKEREQEIKALLEEQIGTIQSEQQANLLKDKILNISVKDPNQQMINEIANLGVERSGLLDRLTVLKNNLQARKQNLGNLPLLEEQQRELERRVEAKQSTYQTLLTQLQQTQVAENQNVGNVRVIANAAIPKQPTGGGEKKLMVLIGGAIGSSLGLATAFILEFKDSSVKDSQEAEKIFGYPLRGIIPDMGRLTATNPLDLRQVRQPNISHSEDNDSSICLRQQDNSATPRSRDAYQILQANLQFLNVERERKAIAITSSVPQEGKSHVANNLASSMARLGKKVLLIDADLRRPIQQDILGLSNSVGLSNILLNQVKLKDAIQHVMPHFDVLTAGIIPDNPVLLLNSRKMKILIENLSNRYDYIILDTPPLNGMADTVILGNIVDGLLLVVRPGVVDYESAIAAKKLLINTGQRVFGIVANGVNLHNEPYTKGYLTRY